MKCKAKKEKDYILQTMWMHHYLGQKTKALSMFEVGEEFQQYDRNRGGGEPK